LHSRKLDTTLIISTSPYHVYITALKVCKWILTSKLKLNNMTRIFSAVNASCKLYPFETMLNRECIFKVNLQMAAALTVQLPPFSSVFVCFK